MLNSPNAIHQGPEHPYYPLVAQYGAFEHYKDRWTRVQEAMRQPVETRFQFLRWDPAGIIRATAYLTAKMTGSETRDLGDMAGMVEILDHGCRDWIDAFLLSESSDQYIATLFPFSPEAISAYAALHYPVREMLPESAGYVSANCLEGLLHLHDQELTQRQQLLRLSFLGGPDLMTSMYTREWTDHSRQILQGVVKEVSLYSLLQNVMSIPDEHFDDQGYRYRHTLKLYRILRNMPE